MPQTIHDDDLRKLFYDIYQKTIAGSFLYLPLWIVLIATYRLYDSHPTEVAVVSLWLGVFFSSRLYYRFLFAKHDEGEELDANYIRTTLMPLIKNTPIFTGLLWGGTFSWLLTITEGSENMVRLLLVVMAICSVSAIAFSCSYRMTMFFITTIMWPVSATLFFSVGHVEFGGLLMLFWLMLAGYSRGQYRLFVENFRNKIELKRQNHQLNISSSTDRLTKLANRQALDEYLEIESARCVGSNSQMALLWIDIDHFKRLNDTHGHLIGDQALAQFGQLLSSFARRPRDMAARYGGEEFLLFLPDSTHHGAFVIAEKVREAVANMPIETDTGEVQITVSIGVSFVDSASGEHPKELLERADKSMYSAKRNGRNQVHFVQ